ncbi:MAG: outer membrane protein assembly factor BamB family protein [Planctomycetota bacterium]|jgi:outer membrane protein assembly factor BamB
MSPRTLVSSLLGASLAIASLGAQDWPHWRGPNYDGTTEAEGLPIDFDQENGVRWATDMPGPAPGTPIVVGDRIYLSSVDTERERLLAMCVSRLDGKIIWTKDAGSGYMAGDRGTRVARGSRTTYASPSPVSDGERVVFFYGNGDLVSYSMDGEEQWRRNIQEEYGDFAFNWTFSASPTIWEGKIFLPVMQRDRPIQRRSGGGRRGRGQGRRGRRGGDGQNAGGQRRGGDGQARRGQGGQRQQRPIEPVENPIESFLLAMDPATGETIYKHARPAPAQMESLEAYTTVIPVVEESGRKVILLVGGDVLTGHDPETGKELFRWGTWNEGHRQRSWRIVPSAVVGDGMALVSAPKRAPVYAIHLGGEGELDDAAIAWQSGGRPNPVSTDVPTPAVHEGFAFVLSDMQHALSKVNMADGEVVWTTPMSRDYLWRASPTIADGKIWCMNHNGQVCIVDEESGEILNTIDMGEEEDDRTRSSIVVAEGEVFIRTNHKLFCVSAMGN